MNRFYDWSRDSAAPIDYGELYARLLFLERHLYEDYEPARHEPSIGVRLSRWLDSAGDEDDQRLLFEMLDYVYFVGDAEFRTLYELAYRGVVLPWLVDSVDGDIVDTEFGRRLNEAVDATWFCPITDSMHIARFHHLNRITGRDLRPDWRTLSTFGSIDRIRDHMRTNGYTRLVLLEDFVGSGGQATDAIEYALSVDQDVSVLVIPLLITKTGLTRLENVVAGYSGAKVRPVVVLGEDLLLAPTATAGEPPRFAEFRDLLCRLDPLVGAPGADLNERVFGFAALGALCVLYTNCPNNAPPALHHTSPTWSPIFPRSSRR